MTSKDVLNQYLAPDPNLGSAFFEGALFDYYKSDDFKAIDTEIHKWTPLPGQDAYDPLKAKIDADFGPCINNFPLDCGNAIDDIGMAVAVVGVVACTAATAGACAVVSGVGTTLGIAGTGVAATNVSQGNAPPEDLIVSYGTTWAGGRFGTSGYGTVGVAIALIQIGYDIWAANR